MRRPTRQKKSDRILHGGVKRAELICDMTAAPLDHKIAEMDRKWGHDKLVELVAPETAQKFGYALAKLYEAIDAGDAEKTAQWTGVCVRGLETLDREATERGAQRASEGVLEVELNGKVYGLLMDARSWDSVREARPDLVLVTPREMAVAVEWWRAHGLGAMHEAVKQAFPGSEVIASRPFGVADNEDEIDL